MEESPSDEPRASRGVMEAIRAHPVVTTVMVVCTLAGALLGPQFLSDEWSLLRQVLGGAVAGAGVGLLLTGTKMLG